MTSPATQLHVGRYRLIRKLATGGMAEVYLAQAAGPAGFTKTLVLKRILPQLAEDAQFVEMFLNEARLAAMLNHPNVMQIFDLGETDGAYFIAMEYIDGPNLRALGRLAEAAGKRLPFEHAAKIVALACEGLGYAHDFAEDGAPLGLIHRDVSPDNILLTRQGAVKVVDFGIAKAASKSHHTRTGTIKGKLSYMPPEQLRGKPLDRRADIFALGVVLYELLAGMKPFEATSDVATMQAILNEPPVPITERRPDCPRELAEIIDRALQKDRERRYPDCRAFQRELERFLLARGTAIGAWELAALVAEIAPTPSSTATPPPLPFDALPTSIEPPPHPTVPGGPAALAAQPQASTVTTPGGGEPWETVSVDSSTTISQALEVEPVREGGRSGLGRGGALALVLAAGAAIGAWSLAGRSDPPAAPDSSTSRATEAERAIDTAAQTEVARPAAPEIAIEPEPPAPQPAIARDSAADETSASERPVVAEPQVVETAATKRPRPVEAKVARATPEPAKPAAKPTSSLYLEVDPPSTVIVDGTPAGLSPVSLKALKPGVHEVRIANEEKGLARRLSITLEPGEERREQVKFGTGKLNFRVRPWAQVEVDGRPYGTTPLPNGVTVFEGERQIRLFNPELNRELIRRVWITAGKEELIKASLEE